MQQENYITRAPAASTRSTHTSETLQYKRFIPHSKAWFTQALKRYPSAENKLRSVYDIVLQSDEFLCFQCLATRALSDYHLASDTTATFRYCDTCASDTMKEGRYKLVRYKEIEDEQQDVEPESIPMIASSQRDDKQTIELPEIHRSEVAHRRVSHHPIFYVGLVFFGCVLFYTLFVYLPPIVQSKWQSMIYQTPPLTQTDVNVGGKDIHLIAQNLYGTIVVISEPMDGVNKFRVYPVAKVSNDALVPTMTYDGMHVVYVHCGDGIFQVDLTGK